MILKAQLWKPLFDAGDLPSWLVALGRDWDLLTMSDDEWAQRRVANQIERALTEVVSLEGRRIAQATSFFTSSVPRSFR